MERKLLQALIGVLPAGATLRLDANGSLTYESACQWLELCDQLSAKIRIEYLEQPLPPDQFAALLKLTQHFQTAVALDESVATLGQLRTCYQQGWRGIFVIKPAICGYPDQLREFCCTHPLDAVFSSVFESEIGRQACLQLATELSNPQRAIGFLNHATKPNVGSIISFS
jgi:O-succinylbenzoate synthase